MTSYRRIASEHRAILIPLVIAILVNVALYGAVVFPLGRQVVSLDRQSREMHDTLRRARLEFQSARATVQGKQEADASLATFYADVLPTSASTAQRITYLRLAQLAREANVRLERGANALEKSKGSTLTKMTTSYSLSGEYRDVRRFIYALETAPEFLVLENVALSSHEQGARGLTVGISVATYFKAGDGA